MTHAFHSLHSLKQVCPSFHPKAVPSLASDLQLHSHLSQFSPSPAPVPEPSATRAPPRGGGSLAVPPLTGRTPIIEMSLTQKSISGVDAGEMNGLMTGYLCYQAQRLSKTGSMGIKTLDLHSTFDQEPCPQHISPKGFGPCRIYRAVGPP